MLSCVYAVILHIEITSFACMAFCLLFIPNVPNELIWWGSTLAPRWPSGWRVTLLSRRARVRSWPPLCRFFRSKRKAPMIRDLWACLRSQVVKIILEPSIVAFLIAHVQCPSGEHPFLILTGKSQHYWVIFEINRTWKVRWEGGGNVLCTAQVSTISCTTCYTGSGWQWRANLAYAHRHTTTRGTRTHDHAKKR